MSLCFSVSGLSYMCCIVWMENVVIVISVFCILIFFGHSVNTFECTWELATACSIHMGSVNFKPVQWKAI